MYRHPAAEHREQDERRAIEVACILRKLRAEAATRVPGWTPELREELRDMFRQWRTGYYY